MVKKSTDGAIIENQQIAEELHKPLFKRFGNCKVNSSFKDNIWSADLENIQLISKFSKWISFFYYVLLIFTVDMHAFFFWKLINVLQLPMIFRKFLYGHKPNKIWVYKC